MLVNLTNDAWFGRTSAAYQHFSMAVFRAVENRRSLVRCANTGISGFIDPVGRVVAQTSLFEDAVVDRDVPELREFSFYTRFGDLLALACLLGLAGLTIRQRFLSGDFPPGGTPEGLVEKLKDWVGRMAGKRR
jgi:apolipoprotein N-acyltransferase